MDFREFWEITPAELNIKAEVFGKRRIEEQKNNLTLEYYNAMWTIQWLGKKSQQPKPLKEIIDNLFKEKKAMSTTDMLEQAKVLNRIFGGEEIRGVE